ncbi:MAG: hypothetical protein E3J72_00825 [Planctomycetota bacterium]|nr:MAG: hypothetical protein E3J72_00825 [Planctomycetota bacterium]
MAAKCQRCGKENPLGTRYCGQCSFDMVSGVTLQTPPGAPTMTSAGTAEDPLIGREIGGCVIEAKIGQGGMGAVYRGMQTSLRRHVAIKILPEHLAENASYISRFLRESEIVASIRHPNIVAVHDRGQAGSIYYFIMELIQGRTVSDLVAEKKTLPPGDALEIARQAALALGTAAEEGIIHRDIKPDNIMIDRGGLVKVTDFGLVKNTMETTGGITAANQVMGTPAFMSPEQCQGRIADHKSDIYSLGMTLYMLLTGGPAFKAETTMAVMYMHINESPEPAHVRNPSVPESIWHVIERMIAKKPEERFQDWPSVLQAFASLVAEHPAEYAVSGLLHRSGSKRLPIVSGVTPTPRATPTADPHTLKIESPVGTKPDLPSRQATATIWRPKKRWLVGAGIGVLVVLVAVVLYYAWPRQSGIVKKPDKTAELQKLVAEVKKALEAGRFDVTQAKMKTLHEVFGDDKNPEIVEAMRKAEERLAKLEAEWRKFHEAVTEARRLQKQDKLADARERLLEARKIIVEVNVHVHLDNAVAGLEDKMHHRYIDVVAQAQELGNQGRWKEAVEVLRGAQEFAVDDTEAKQAAQAIAAAEEKKEAVEEEQFAEKLQEARGALAKRDMETAKSRIAELSKLRPGNSNLKELSDRIRIESVVTIPAGKAKVGEVVSKVSAFTVGAYEVTNQQFSEFIKAGGYGKKAYWSDEGWLWRKKNKITAPRFWNDPRFNKPKYPVVGISWHEAEAYCSWLSEISGKRYRLPTEAEWERAAAGPEGAKWPWGKETENPPANLRSAAADWTTPVGQFPKGKSAAGCFDIIGNVAEWCGSGRARCARGGSWLASLEQVKSDSNRPIPASTRVNRIGFRFVREVD